MRQNSELTPWKRGAFPNSFGNLLYVNISRFPKAPNSTEEWAVTSVTRLLLSRRPGAPLAPDRVPP
jgi:hypothetical protein